MDTTLANLRQEYSQQSLDRADVLPDPVAQFERWFTDTQQAQIHEPNAMHLATVSANGHPSGRVVLLKGIEGGSFLFYTNFRSQKGQHLLRHPYAALTFFWPELERQVRIEGSVSQLSDEQSTAYFHSRPRGSQLGAWVSPQSEVIADRSVLEQRQHALAEQYADQPIPRPPHWGGFALHPDRLEFWQGRPSRLHDRLRYRQLDDNTWIMERLVP
jgi:pyridoxamine 5'-phosphate oxidase